MSRDDEGIVWRVANRYETPWICGDCGALVENKGVHTKWHRERLESVKARAWDEGFDAASDDIGRSQVMQEMGEGLNPHRSNDAESP